MRSFVGVLVAVASALLIYYFYLRSIPSDNDGTLAMQSVSLTGVKSDLIAIAQAERLYIGQNGTCGNMDTLTSSASLALAKNERDGYTYRIDCSGTNFSITARHLAAPPEGTAITYPILSIDENMRIRQTN